MEKRKISTVPNTADANDPIRMAILPRLTISASAKASVSTKIDMVNPIPPRQATAKSIFQPAPSGISASFVFTASQLASWLAVKTKLAEMPEGAGWKMLFAVACLGGIGFTMSIFVDTLAFADAEIVSRGKIAILMGSFASAVLGTVLIFLFSKKKTRI